MVDLWFVLVCAMFAAYVVLDGYDLGAGILSPFVAKTDSERLTVLHTILPFWDGNEVFLVAGGASLYLAFPRLFPAFVSGFYLPVMMVLWLLMLRGLGIEMRHKLDQPLWNRLWDGSFFVSSAGLVLFYGVALGNIVRGVSVDANGDFFAALWTNFRVGDDVGIFDWYTSLVGVVAVVVVTRHGALRLAARTDPGSPVHVRSLRIVHLLVAPCVILGALTTVATFFVQPRLEAAVRIRPWIGVFAALALAGLVASELLVRTARENRLESAFRASSCGLVGLFAAACVGVHPYGLVARIAERSVLLRDAAADDHALEVGLIWWIPGMLGVVGYSIFAHCRLLRGSAASE